MQVDVEEMRCGASLSYAAAWLAYEAAGVLSRSTVSAGLFGAFPAARHFGAALQSTHRTQVDLLRRHESELNSVGDNAHTAATAFVSMERRNAQALHSML